jgi:molybdate-binding protein
MLKGEDNGIMAKVDVNVEVVGKMAKQMQMLLKGEDDDMGMMAKVDMNVEGWR